MELKLIIRPKYVLIAAGALAAILSLASALFVLGSQRRKRKDRELVETAAQIITEKQQETETAEE